MASKNFKVLFVCKSRVNSYGISFGLINSAQMLSKALSEAKIPSEMACVVDGNAIDAEISKRKPTHVIINALWVTPEKTAELCRLHPKVAWSIMIHSKPTFLAMEGIASKWIAELVALQSSVGNLWVSANSTETCEMLTSVFKAKSFFFPNAYSKPDQEDKSWIWPWSHQPVGHDGILNVGCFGAIRPLKNHYAQAAAAIIYADKSRVKLAFHVNSGREEQGGENVLKNLSEMFKATKSHVLVGHEWYPQWAFVKEVLPGMDVCMQVSLTETYNIVAADAVTAKIPSIGSPDVYWMASEFRANPSSLDDISEKLEYAVKMGKAGVAINSMMLDKANRQAIRIWTAGLKKMVV